MPLAQPIALPGTYVIAGLPPASQNARMFAWATDRVVNGSLSPGYVISDGTTWNLPVGASVAKLSLIGDVVLTETLIVSLSVGMKRKTLALTGVSLTDKILAIPNGAPTAGCEVINAYPGPTANNVSLGYYTPLLGIGATYTIPVSIYRVS